MKKIGLLFLAVCMMACSRVNYNPDESKEEATQLTTICTNEDKTITFYSQGDEIKKMEESSYQDLSESLSEDTDKDALLASVTEDLNKKYGSIEGVEFQISWEENLLHTILTIDYEKASIEDLKKAGIIEDDEDESEGESKYISLEDSLLSYQENGYACEANEE